MSNLRFHALDSSLAAVHGFTPVVMQQANLKHEILRLRKPSITFCSGLGSVFILLPFGQTVPSAEALDAAWLDQGSPAAAPSGVLLFGESLTYALVEHAGIDACVEEPTGLTLYCRHKASALRTVTVDGQTLPTALHDYRRQKLQTAIDALAARWQPHLLRPYQSLTMATRKMHAFGTCSSSGDILLSDQLVSYPLECIEQTFLHECAHLSQFNHNLTFYQVLTTYLPDWVAQSALQNFIYYKLHE